MARGPPARGNRLTASTQLHTTRMRAAIVVAHPDDEVLWCGGWILLHRDWHWRIYTLCRASDPDRAPRFHHVLERLGAEGDMADLDDGPDQTPLPAGQVQSTVQALLPVNETFDLVLTHGPVGEYTRHLRHEECCRAVVTLWARGQIRAKSLWCFAYDDGDKVYLPRVSSHAVRRVALPDDIWSEKYRLITEYYGFGPDSWEARVTPREEGFSCFDSPGAAVHDAGISEEVA